MNIYHLHVKPGFDSPYDSYLGFIIRAKSAKQARKIASKNAYDEGGCVWLDKKYSYCKIVKLDGKEGVILGSFLNG